MTEYWNKLPLKAKWNKRDRFNYIMEYLESEGSASEETDDDG